jgi:hypothetical protein
MDKLYVIGSCYSDNTDNAKELFKVLEDAGYILGYNMSNKNSCTIMKEMEEPVEE